MRAVIDGHGRVRTPAPRPATARIAGASGRRLTHEWTLAAIGSALLAALMTWPTLRDPTRTIPQDVWDPTMQAWQVAWVGHALIHEPTSLWHANVSHPHPFTLAFSDSLLGYAPLAIVGEGPAATVLRYNILFVLAFALAHFGGYALARQLGANRMGAAVAGAALAYAPWRFAHAGHLNILSAGGIALALAMLARGHGWSLTSGFAPERVRPRWALAGWLVAAWQLTLGFGLGVPFGYVLAAVSVVVAVRAAARRLRGHPVPGRLLVADIAGGLAFVLVVWVMAYPYQRVVELNPDARRTVAWLDLFSPPPRGFLTATAESWLWGDAHAGWRRGLSWPAEMTVLPGFCLYGLAAAGLLFSIWTLRQRLVLAAGVLVSIWLAMGTAAPGGGEFGYLLLFRLPGFDGIRTPGRLVLWTTLLLGVLAAGAVAALTTRGRAPVDEPATSRSIGWVRAWTVVPLLLVLAEGVHSTPHPRVPQPPRALATVRDPVLVLPTDQLADMHVMLWSTAGFPRTVNGSSGYNPPEQGRLRESMELFPDVRTVEELRQLGVRTVVVLRDRAIGTPYERALYAPVDALGIRRRESGDAVVFSLP